MLALFVLIKSTKVTSKCHLWSLQHMWGTFKEVDVYGTDTDGGPHRIDPIAHKSSQPLAVCAQPSSGLSIIKQALNKGWTDTNTLKAPQPFTETTEPNPSAGTTLSRAD